MTTHNLLPKHGQAIGFDLNSARVQAQFNRIIDLQQQASIGMSEMLIGNDEGQMIVPCTQCMRDVALMFKDLAGAIEELIDLEAKL